MTDTTFNFIEVVDSFSEYDDADVFLILSVLHASLQKLTHLNVLQQELDTLFQRINSAHQYYKRKKQGLTSKLYPSWSSIERDTPDYIFRRKFRMSKETFRAFCAKINSKVGNSEFKPETHCPPHHICGEIRVAIGLRILFGASYLDLVGRAFGVASIQSIYNFFNTTIDWINATFCFELVDMLNQLRCGNNNALAELK